MKILMLNLRFKNLCEVENLDEIKSTDINEAAVYLLIIRFKKTQEKSLIS